jgi:uncharacterized protein (TIGR03382 family)
LKGSTQFHVGSEERIVLRRTTLIAIFACFVALPAGAGVIIIGNYSAGSTQVEGSSFGSPASKAAGWTMPSGTNYSLDSVKLDLEYHYWYTGLPAPVVTAAIYGDSGSGPTGSPLVILTDPAFVNASTDANYLFTPPSAFTLTAGTTYWLVMSASDPSGNGQEEIDWMKSDPLITPTGIATLAGYRFDSSGGVPPLGSSSTYNTFEVDGTQQASSTPEPATTLIAAAGLSLVLLRRRRR